MDYFKFDFLELAARLDEVTNESRIIIKDFNWENKEALDAIKEKLNQISASESSKKFSIEFFWGLDFWDFENTIFDDARCITDYFLPISVYKFNGYPKKKLEKCYMPYVWKDSPFKEVVNICGGAGTQFDSGTYIFTLSSKKASKYIETDLQDFEKEFDVSKINNGYTFVNCMNNSKYAYSDGELGVNLVTSEVLLKIEKKKSTDPRFPMEFKIKYDVSKNKRIITSSDGKEVFFGEDEISTNCLLQKSLFYEGLFDVEVCKSETFSFKKGFNFYDISLGFTSLNDSGICKKIPGTKMLLSHMAIQHNYYVTLNEYEVKGGYGYVVKTDAENNKEEVIYDDVQANVEVENSEKLNPEAYRLIDVDTYQESYEKLSYSELKKWIQKGLEAGEDRKFGKLEEASGEVRTFPYFSFVAYKRNQEVDTSVRVRIDDGEWFIPLRSVLLSDNKKTDESAKRMTNGELRTWINSNKSNGHNVEVKDVMNKSALNPSFMIMPYYMFDEDDVDKPVNPLVKVRVDEGEWIFPDKSLLKEDNV